MYSKKKFSIYTLQPPRRLEDFAAMIITTETDPQRSKRKRKSFFILNYKYSWQFVYNKYKTYKTFGQLIIDINKDLSDILNNISNVIN